MELRADLVSPDLFARFVVKVSVIVDALRVQIAYIPKLSSDSRLPYR